jgi:CHAD domain-containing protein|nr:CHAD domain-containing protein [uncultured Nitrososphaera sp.]
MPDDDGGTQFAKNLKTSAARVKKRLAAYLDDPGDEENVHAMRTSLRRLEAALSLLPKKERKRNRKRADACKAFFRANSRVRDLDIVRARVTALGGEQQFVSAVAGRRKAALGWALALARSVEKNKTVAAKNIDGDELAARMDKVAGRLTLSIKERLPVVAGDGSKKEELHELRKDMKKLRYVLEILPAGRRKKHGRQVAQAVGGNSKSAVARLKELQAMLGQIHDCDITIEYLQGVKGAEAMLQKEKSERDALYEKFTKTIS